MEVFERTGLVVYTVGSGAKPALTCQARPQDGESFGEFPPRHELHTFTHLPVIIPSSTPGYNSTYTDQYLVGQANAYPSDVKGKSLLKHVSPRMQGYLATLANYLNTSCGPKRSPAIGSQRTALYGLQRPPLLPECPTLIRIRPGVSAEVVAPYLLPFVATNAADGVEVSSTVALPFVQELGLKAVVENDSSFAARVKGMLPYNVVYPEQVDAGTFIPLLAMHWLSRLFPMGHIKSSVANDEAFIAMFSQSRKWLTVARSSSL